jgi:hypothetical protein
METTASRTERLREMYPDFFANGGPHGHVDKCPHCDGRVIIDMAEPAPHLRRASNEPVDRGGHKAGATGSAHADALGEFNRRVAAKVAAGLNRQKAVARVAKEDPTLHQEMLRQYNARGRRV